MTTEHKTHYRKVFKSDHLGKADLEDFLELGSDLIFTIAQVRQEIGAKVAGKKIDANIAYFQEKIKPLVLNATNSQVMRNLTGSAFIEDWQGVTVQLYIDKTASLKGEIVGGVRINPKKIMAKQTITKDSQAWVKVVESYKSNGNFNAVLKRANVSQSDMQFIVDGVASGDL